MQGEDGPEALITKILYLAAHKGDVVAGRLVGATLHSLVDALGAPRRRLQWDRSAATAEVIQ